MDDFDLITLTEGGGVELGAGFSAAVLVALVGAVLVALVALCEPHGETLIKRGIADKIEEAQPGEVPAILEAAEKVGLLGG